MAWRAMTLLLLLSAHVAAGLKFWGASERSAVARRTAKGLRALSSTATQDSHAGKQKAVEFNRAPKVAMMETSSRKIVVERLDTTGRTPRLLSKTSVESNMDESAKASYAARAAAGNEELSWERPKRKESGGAPSGGRMGRAAWEAVEERQDSSRPGARVRGGADASSEQGAFWERPKRKESGGAPSGGRMGRAAWEAVVSNAAHMKMGATACSAANSGQDSTKPVPQVWGDASVAVCRDSDSRALSSPASPKPFGGKPKTRDSGKASSGGRTGRNPWEVVVERLGSVKPAPRVQSDAGAVSPDDSGADELKCIHFGSCSGCSMRGNFTAAPVMLRAKAFFSGLGVDLPIHLGDAVHWRTHAKLAVRPMSKWGGMKIGLFMAGSHVVEAIPSCRVHHPRINDAAEELRTAALDSGVSAYSEASEAHDASGDLRYIQLSLEHTSNKVQLALVWNAPSVKDSDPSLGRLIKRLKARSDLWHSIAVNFNQATTNPIFNNDPRAWVALWGPPTMEVRVGQATFAFPPQIFRQANLDMFEKGIIPAVSRQVLPGSRVAELYAGLGVIGINLAAQGQAASVLCSDSNAFVDKVFDSAVDSLPTEKVRARVAFECLPADEAFKAGQCFQADVLVVDPPRRGLTSGVLEALTSRDKLWHLAPHLNKVVYVSCGFESLKRDVELLTGSKLWSLTAAEGVALFPGSDHVEIVATFSRARP